MRPAVGRPALSALSSKSAPVCAAQFIDKEDELDTLLVGYFCKILVVLMRKRPERSEDYFAEHPDVIDKLLRHSTSLCVADFFINLLGAGMQVEGPLLPTEFLSDHKVIARLVERIAPPAGPDARASAATILKSLLQNGQCDDFPDAPTAPLVGQLMSAECTDRLVRGNPCTSGVSMLVLHTTCARVSRARAGGLLHVRVRADARACYGGSDSGAGNDARGTKQSTGRRKHSRSTSEVGLEGW